MSLSGQVEAAYRLARQVRAATFTQDPSADMRAVGVSEDLIRILPYMQPAQIGTPLLMFGESMYRHGEAGMRANAAERRRFGIDPKVAASLRFTGFMALTVGSLTVELDDTWKK